MSAQIRISQCMIVKNEEETVRKALSWGKNIVCEQLVADTGSTDQTAVIAKALGAFVYEFPWQEDFSAAKNNVIEKASGDWIIFTDSDEYFSEEEAKKILPLLELVNERPEDAIACRMLQLDDDGNVFQTDYQARIFRNGRGIRYSGRIHERLVMPDKTAVAVYHAGSQLSVIHTGYSKTAMNGKQKAERNIRMLEKELLDHQGGYDTMSYLADALTAAGKKEAAYKLLVQVLDAPADQVSPVRWENSVFQLLNHIVEQDEGKEEEKLLHIYEKAIRRNKENPDFDYCAGVWMMNQEQWDRGIHYLQSGLKKLETYLASGSLYMAANLSGVYTMLAYAFSKKEQPQEAVRYCIFVLRINRFHELALSLLLQLFSKSGTTGKDALGVLKQLYSLDRKQEQEYLRKAAVAGHYKELERLLIQA